MRKVCLLIIVALSLGTSVSSYARLNNLGITVAQEGIRVSGVVTDSNGEPLPGVNVVVKGSTIGSVTDGNGRFLLRNVPRGAILTFSYVGYITKQIKAGDGDIRVKLEEDTNALSEVIVTGVASGTSKLKLGFSIEKVSSKELEKVPAIDAASAIQGKVAGIRITKTSGAPGSEYDVQLRGVKTIFGSSNPLYIIDGVLTENGMADINSEDIESIEVLKGAAASSLYGSRAANGVVSIITKRGTTMDPGKLQVDFRSEFGKNYIGYIPKQSSSTNYSLNEDGSINYGVTEDDQVYDTKYPVTYDHIKQFFRPGTYFTNHIALKGTSQNNRISVYTSLQTTKEQGVVKMVNGINRTNVKLNVDYRITDQLTFSTSNLYTEMFADNRADGVFSSLFQCDPDANLLEENTDGSPYKVNVNKLNSVVNPLYSINNSINKSKSEKLLSFFQLKYAPTNYLTFSASYGATRSNGESLYMIPKGTLNYDLTTSTGYISRGMWRSKEQAVTIDGMLNKKFGDFNLKLKLQYLYETSNSSSLSGGGSDLGISGTKITSVNLSSNQSTSSAEYRNVANNYAGMFVLDYKEKYIFDSLIRRDGSSLFGKDVRWQTFYRLSGAWRITEDFKIRGINEWKLRLSYGVAGLRPPYEAQYEVFALDNGVPGNMETLGNTKLKPSFSKETEIGTDIRFLDRFNFSINYSVANNTDQILKVPITALSGASYQWQNAGTIQTKVLEASFNANIFNNKDFKWDAGLTFDKVKQKITKLNCTPYMIDGTRFRIQEGVEFGVLYLDKFAHSLDEVLNQVPTGYTVDEVFAINNQGFVVRRSEIGTINETPVKVKDDKGNIVSLPTRSMTPNFNLNLNTTFSYKGFTLYMLWAYQNGGAVYDHAVRYITEPALFDQSGKPWNQVKAATYYSNGGQSVGMLGWDNDVLLYDADFLKLRELSVSYDFKIKKYEKYIKNIRVSLIGRNLLVLTKFPGYDPEGVTGSSSKGVDSNIFRFESNDAYPLYKTISGSIALTF